MKRILIICETLSPGGAERQIVSDVNQLVKNGWEVTLAYWMGGSLEDRINPNVMKFQLPSRDWLRRLIALLKFCRKENFDLINSHLTGANLLASISGKLTGTPVIITEHGLGLWRLDKLKFRLVVTVTFRLANKIVAVCNATKRVKLKFERADPNKMEVIYNCYDKDVVSQSVDEVKVRATNNIAPQARVVGFVGRLEKVKRLDLLVDIANKVVQNIPNILFLVVGDGTCRSEIESLVENAGLKDRFRFVGTQSNVAQFYKLMDVFVLTSEREALSVAILEAMASGLPVVAFDVGGNAESVSHGKTGYIVPFGDNNRFASNIIDLLTKDDLRKEMSECSLKRSKTIFSPAARLSALENLYTTVTRETRN